MRLYVHQLFGGDYLLVFAPNSAVASRLVDGWLSERDRTGYRLVQQLDIKPESISYLPQDRVLKGLDQ